MLVELLDISFAQNPQVIISDVGELVVVLVAFELLHQGFHLVLVFVNLLNLVLHAHNLALQLLDFALLVLCVLVALIMLIVVRLLMIEVMTRTLI